MVFIMTYNIPPRAGIEEANRAILEQLHRRVPGPFTTAEAAQALSLDEARVSRLLRYLAKRGWLARVRRGLYITVPLGAADPGAWREDPWVVAARVFAPCYIGGWTALQHWSLTEQLFRDVMVVTARPVRSRHVEVQTMPFQLKHASEDKHFGLRTVWRGQIRVAVSNPARTLVDVLDEPGIGGGIRHIAAAVTSYWENENRCEADLLTYAERLGNRTVFKRLGFLLETLGIDASPIITACLERQSTGLSPLDPTVQWKGYILKRWNLRVNVELSGSAKE
jgi:predicted transcriptional regulator of viral defense system